MGGYDKQVVEKTVVDMNEFSREVGRMVLADLVMPGLEEREREGVDEVDGNEDRPWREVE